MNADAQKRYMDIFSMAIMKEHQVATGQKAAKPITVCFQGIQNSLVKKAVPFIQNLRDCARFLRGAEEPEDEENPGEMAEYEESSLKHA